MLCQKEVLSIKKLNIYVDETGDFGNTIGSSLLYGISFVLIDNNVDVTKEIFFLNNQLNNIGCYEMIHMSDLVFNRNYFKIFSIKDRKAIFKILYNFVRKIDIKLYSIFIDKSYINNSLVLRKKIIKELKQMINNNKDFFKKYDEVILYYDNGQEKLGKIIDAIFSDFSKYNHIIEFDKKEEKLFQVADMLTYVDKYNYKYYHQTKNEKKFFNDEEMRIKLRNLKNKRLK